MLTNCPPNKRRGSLCGIRLKVDEHSSASYWASQTPPPQGLHNPIFWALILLHCLKASQTETYNTIIDNALHHPSSSLPHGPHPRRNPLIILKEPRGKECGFLQLPGNIKFMKCCSLKCPFDIKGTCWEREQQGCNVAFDQQGCRVCL